MFKFFQKKKPAVNHEFINKLFKLFFQYKDQLEEAGKVREINGRHILDAFYNDTYLEMYLMLHDLGMDDYYRFLEYYLHAKDKIKLEEIGTIPYEKLPALSISEILKDYLLDVILLFISIKFGLRLGILSK